MKLLHLALLAIYCAVPAAYSQTGAPEPAPAQPDSSPDLQAAAGALPGLVARGYLGGDHPPLKFPTPVVFVIKAGSEFPDVIRPRMENELRGTMDVGRLEYSATGLIVLENDTEVRFDITNMVCKVDGKDFGDGKYTQPMKKGKHTVELIRRGWASGKPTFVIAGATSDQPVLFHTAAALKREVERSIKVGDEPAKSKLVGPVTE